MSKRANEYLVSAELSRRINDAALELKRAVLRLPGVVGTREEAIEKYASDLAAVLGALIPVLDADVDVDAGQPRRTSRRSQVARIPEVVADRLRKWRGNEPYLGDDLRRTREHLLGHNLEDSDLEFLDCLAETLTQASSAAHRRLMR